MNSNIPIIYNIFYIKCFIDTFFTVVYIFKNDFILAFGEVSFILSLNQRLYEPSHGWM